MLEYDQHKQAMPLIGALGIDEIVADVQAVVDDLASDAGITAERVAVLGFCFGERRLPRSTLLRAPSSSTAPGIAAGPPVSGRGPRLRL
ncbi:hypothetical protein GCM10010530_18050 [Kribbella aluminosa]